MKKRINPLQISLLLFFVLLILYVFHLEKGYSESIKWELTSEANKEVFIPYSFSKGVFSFDLSGYLYKISQRFSALPISHNEGWAYFYLIIIWAGMAGLLAITSYWKRYSFLGVCAVFILIFNFLQLDSLDLFGLGANTRWVTIIGIVLTIGPAYLFHAFFPNTSMGVRWLILTVFIGGFFGFLNTIDSAFHVYWLSNATFALAIFTMLFIFLVSEEIVYLILYFITKSKGGKNNEKHFLIFGGAYVIYLALYYLKKAGFLDTNINLINPFYLLLISSLIASWSIKFKQSLYDSIQENPIDIRWIFIALGMVMIGYMNLGFVRGNDPVYESMHYIIIYAHLGFGFMFLAYIALNFITPLAQGLQIFKIAYKERNFPYSTARLGGLAAVAAFFFLANREPLDLTLAAKNNLLGDYYTMKSEPVVSKEYYKLSSMHGWDNHYANYTLATIAAKEQDVNEAYYRYFRASRRYPSPYAFINAGNRLSELEKNSEVISLLREAQVEFSDNPEIKNNLALALFKNNAITEGIQLLNNAEETESWNEATLVNRWSAGYDSMSIMPDYQAGDVATKTNILAQNILENETNPLTADLSSLEGNVNLHKITYLINSNWSFPGFDSLNIFSAYLENMTLAELRRDLIHSYVISQYKKGNVYEAFRQFDPLQNQSNSIIQGYYLNQLGLLSLDQYAPKLALDFFTRSAEKGNTEGKFNRLVAHLECAEWEKAQQLIATEPEVFGELPQQVENVISNQNDRSIAFYYYRWQQFAPEELLQSLLNRPKDQVIQVWQKIRHYFISKNDMESLKTYASLFNSILGNQEKTYLMNMMEKNLQADSAKAIRNPFNEELIYAFLEDSTASLDVKYNLIVEAVEYNPYSEGLLKSYCFTALDLGLNDYAEYSLLRLYEILPKEEYRNFERIYDDYKSSKQENWTF